jgi:hypothetical protein
MALNLKDIEAIEEKINKLNDLMPSQLCARLAADHVRAAINAPVKCSDCGKIIPQIGGSVNKIEPYKPQIEKEPELIEQLREPEDRDEAKPDHYGWKIRTNPCECCGRQTVFPKCRRCSTMGHKRCRE